MRGLKALVTVVALTAATPLLAQEAPETPTQEGTELALVAADGQPDYVAWDETAARAEALSEAGRGSAFALTRLREEIVGWRDVFANARAANAARIATVQAQIDALGPLPAEAEPEEDARVAGRRADLDAQLARLRAPGLLAHEAYVHAYGLIGVIDYLNWFRLSVDC